MFSMEELELLRNVMADYRYVDPTPNSEELTEEQVWAAGDTLLEITSTEADAENIAPFLKLVEKWVNFKKEA